ncbi:MAG: tyrosine-type recombinase/integrase [Anaerolineales bacterium]|nr:tyrosine-type recombinase/integrase [Anaerolineales bacterium]MBX3004716.1 tyrosine-type recombinase/integrase [Anaerolineales bacterium]
MLSNKKTREEWALASAGLQDAYTDFILSRQAILCSEQTIKWYGYTAGNFIGWLKENNVGHPAEIQARHVRLFLAELVGKGLKDSSVNGYARSIKTLLKFLHAEGYTPIETKFSMPAVAKKRLPIITAEELRHILASTGLRDTALIMLLVDSGLRRAELCALNWEDIDLENGAIQVHRGKGGKARIVVIGAKTRRALLRYRRTIEAKHNSPVIQTRDGFRVTFGGLRSILLRISKRTGIHITPHALRRTFATLSLRAGMNPLHLQGLLGHSSLEMTNHYVQMLDDDLQVAHRTFGPIDNHL